MTDPILQALRCISRLYFKCQSRKTRTALLKANPVLASLAVEEARARRSHKAVEPIMARRKAVVAALLRGRTA